MPSPRDPLTAVADSPAWQPPGRRRILGLALPAAGSFILSNLYNINDLFFAGRISLAANNAIGLCMMVLIFNAGFVVLASRGALSLVARLTGARDPQGAGRAAAQGMLLCFGITVPVAVLGWLGAPHLLEWMGGRGEVLELASRYLRMIYLGFPFLAIAPLIDSIFLARGDSRTPFQNQLIAVALNTSLNALVVYGLHWGIAGIAGASILSRALAGARGYWLLTRGPRRLPLPAFRDWRPVWHTQLEMIRVGLPAGLSVAFYSGIFMVLNRLLARFGQEAFGVLGIGIRGIESIGFMVVMGFGVAASALSGQAIGAGRSDSARLTAWRVTGAAFPIVAGFSLLWLLLPRPLIAIYTSDPTVTELTVVYLRMAAVANLFQMLENIPGDSLSGAGVPRLQFMVNVPGNLLRIPLAWWLVEGVGLGINGVWLAILASAVLKGLAMVAVFQFSDWPGQARRRMDHTLSRNRPDPLAARATLLDN
jgi:putative MATE family efflux protein